MIPQSTRSPRTEPGLRREILALAVPALLTLIAEPLFLLADTAIVGHLGTSALAALGVASAALLTVVGLCVFLAYATTSLVARRLGAGDRDGAYSAGADGIWLALALGIPLAALLGVYAGPVAAAFGVSSEAATQATEYLRISALGIPAMLVVLAATGLLRGLQDTRSPLIAATAGFLANIVLNTVFVLGLGWGIAGSAWGTVAAQCGMALGLVAAVLARAQRDAVQLARYPHPRRVLAAAVAGAPLLLRTVALRVALLATTWVAAGLGDQAIAAHQVTMTIWATLAFALDALAIAAQALVGRAVGAADLAGVRAMTATMIRWGIGAGFALGALIIGLHTVLGHAFSGDPMVRGAIATALLVVALGQPLAGVVFVLDGVLIGAGDHRWLAVAQVVCLLVYAPLLGAVYLWGSGMTPAAGLVWLWLAWTGFMLARAATLGWRSRHTEAWATPA